MQLLKHFKELTIRPKNTQKLKGLILQLAIQGKLTSSWREKNPNIEPASELIGRIEKEKVQLIEEKKIKKEKSLTRINKDEMPFELPVNWNWFNLGDLGNAQTGTTPPTKNPENYGTFIPFLGPADISNSSMQYPIEGLSEEGLRKGRLIESNSLMMVCIGGSMGKCNINRKDVSCNQQINIITPICSPVEYIKIVCQSPYFQMEVWDRSTGSATPMINKNKWLQIPISVPPLAEQEEIVKVVEILFKEVEQLEQLTLTRIGLKEDFVTSALNQLTTNNANQEWIFLQDHFKSFFNETTSIKKLRETVLQLAVQGKLTADWRSRHPELVSGTHHASELLKRIQKEKTQLIKDKIIKKEKALPKITEEEIPYELPEGWVWCRMGEIAKKLGAGSTPSGGKSAYVDEGIKFFRSQNIYNTYLKLDQVAYITDAIHEKMKGTKVKPKDILLNITGGSIGRCSLISDDFDTANVSQHVAIVRMIELETRKYIHKFITSKGFQDRIMDVQVGVSREGLSMTKLKMFPTPLPPQEEQKAIVEKVNALMGLCDALEQEVQQSQEHSEMLMQSVLREVFEGEKEVII